MSGRWATRGARSLALLAILPTVALAAIAPAPGLSAGAKSTMMKGLVGEVNFLLNNSASFWLEHGLDRLDGGFYGTISRNGTSIDPTGKGFTAEARYLWGFATLYENGLVGEEAAVICDSLYDLMYNHFRDPTDDLYWMRVAKNGSRMLTKSTADEEANVLYSGVKKWMYGQSFATLSFARYAIAFNKTDALNAAMANFKSWDKKFHDSEFGGYDQTMEDGRWIDFKGDKPPVGKPQVAVQKITNVHLHLLSALSELYLASKEPLVADRLYEMLDIFNTKVIQPQGYGNAYFTRNWTAIGDFNVAVGHDLETSQLLLEAADTLQGTKYAANATKLAKDAALRMTPLAVKYGYDYQHGGWYNSVNMTNTNPPTIQDIDADHIWWVQAEALPALFQLYKFTGDESLMRKIVGTLDWIKFNQRDVKYGEVYWGVWPDGTPDARGTNKGEFWKANYHITHGLIKLRELLLADPAMSASA